MTRETKIGLLVGLAFIIVIGILLSDHLTASTEPPPAAIAQAGQNVRAAIHTPAGSSQQPPVTVIQPPQVQPQQTVQTANDLTPKPQPVTMVQIAPPAQSQDGPVTVAQRENEAPAVTPNAMPTQSQYQPQPISPPSNDQPIAGNFDTRTTEPTALPPTNLVAPRQDDPMIARLNGEAQRFGESVVPAGGETTRAGATAAGKKYKAEAGDTLARIAQKNYGSSSKVYRDAILEANPALKANPNLVIEGRGYVIPEVKAAATTPDAAPVQIASPTQRPQTSKGIASSDSVYVVEEGDNLTRIAAEQLGSPDGVAAIKELNRDLLKGGDVIRPGMKLKLPAKVAANN